MLRLALSNVLHHKVRALLSVAAIAFQITLLVVLIGLSTGTIREAGERIEAVQSDIIVLPPDAHYVLGMSTATMPLEPMKALIESSPDVVVAAPVVLATTNALGGYGLVFGIDPASYLLAGRGSLALVEGHQLQAPDDMLVDTRLARAQKLRLGQRVELLNHGFRICGIVRDGAGVRIYLPMATLQDLLGRPGKASAFFVRAAAPDRVGSILDHLRRTPALDSYKIFPSSRYTELLGSNAVGLKEFHLAITGISVGFGAMVVLLAMYTAILERTRQIGILKSLGAGRAYIISGVVLEATLLCIVGVPAGFVMAVGTRVILDFVYPTLNVIFSPQLAGYATLVALVSGVLGALYPALGASRVDPVVAMNYE